MIIIIKGNWKRFPFICPPCPCPSTVTGSYNWSRKPLFDWLVESVYKIRYYHNDWRIKGTCWKVGNYRVEILKIYRKLYPNPWLNSKPGKYERDYKETKEKGDWRNWATTSLLSMQGEQSLHFGSHWMNLLLKQNPIFFRIQ